MAKTAEDVLAEFEKKHGLKIGRPAPVVGLPTGNLAVDWQTGVGGIPRGRITELYGFEASGKTTTALQTAAQLQRQLAELDKIVYLDYEHALDSDYAESLGIDFDAGNFITLQPDYLEQGAKAALDLIETGQVRMVIFDSVAAMTPHRQTDGEFDQATIQMHRAKLVSALCGSLKGMLSEKDCAAIFVNHKMEGIELTGRPGMPPKVTTPGGRGLKFYASLRLEFNILGSVRDKTEDLLSRVEINQLVGQKVSVTCVKNKVGKPGRVVELRSRFGHGFDNHWSALKVLTDHKLVSKSGSWFTFFPDRTPGLTPNLEKFQLQGEAQVLDRAEQQPEWGTELIRLAQTTLANLVETE